MIHPKPVVGIPVDVKIIDNAPFHAVGEKYINAIAHGAGCFPLLMPAMSNGAELRSMKSEHSLSEVVNQFDGVFLPGSYSNIHPGRYGNFNTPPVLPNDHQRDETTLELIQLCVEHKIPLLAVCRGFQEVNVAFGGTINQEIHELPEYMDHREKYELPRSQHYDHAHEVKLRENGILHNLNGQITARVNSLHGQGINKLGDGLRVEAVAPDSLIEAVTLKNAESFLLGVQWHPEWRFWEDALSKTIFKAFGDATKTRHGSEK